MIIRKTYVIPARLIFEEPVDGLGEPNKKISPDFDQIELPILSFNVKKTVWIEDKMYMEVELLYDESEETAITAKHWELKEIAKWR